MSTLLSKLLAVERAGGPKSRELILSSLSSTDPLASPHCCFTRWHTTPHACKSDFTWSIPLLASVTLCPLGARAHAKSLLVVFFCTFLYSSLIFKTENWIPCETDENKTSSEHLSTFSSHVLLLIENYEKWSGSSEKALVSLQNKSKADTSMQIRTTHSNDLCYIFSPAHCGYTSLNISHVLCVKELLPCFVSELHADVLDIGWKMMF